MNPSLIPAIMLPATVSSILSNSNSRVTNNTIVYNDTVLDLKDLGSNINVQTISDVGEYSFKDCLETIFKSNPNVTFNTIQYSRAEKKIYIYSDRIISTKEWNDRNTSKKTYSKVNVQVLEDLKNLFENIQECPKDAITLYDVMNVSKNMYKEIENIHGNYINVINKKLRQKYSQDSYCKPSLFHDFDYKTNEMGMDFQFYSSVEAKFKKEAGDLYISECNSSYYEDEILPLAGTELSKLFDSYLNYQNFYTGRARIGSLNTGFTIEITQHSTDLLIPIGILTNEFCLKMPNYSETNKIESNSLNIIEILKGKEKELFKRILVKIDDCPEWMRPILYLQKMSQLDRQNYFINFQEEKQEPKGQFIRKILSYFRNDKKSNE